MFCTNCGSSVPDTANFCTACGSAVQRAPAARTSAAQPAATRQYSQPVQPPPRAPQIPRWYPAGAPTVCPWCGAEISAAQLSCPRCGATRQSSRRFAANPDGPSCPAARTWPSSSLAIRSARSKDCTCRWPTSTLRLRQHLLHASRPAVERSAVEHHHHVAGLGMEAHVCRTAAHHDAGAAVPAISHSRATRPAK